MYLPEKFLVAQMSGYMNSLKFGDDLYSVVQFCMTSHKQKFWFSDMGVLHKRWPRNKIRSKESGDGIAMLLRDLIVTHLQ
jgi:hypothetical protein